ncbi:MAG: hypothetical protein F6K28_37230 [Microcoleus sp. SIO2G3]|nr:hypothetical protein [Microcoleus sp. SIO2G3]
MSQAPLVHADEPPPESGAQFADEQPAEVLEIPEVSPAPTEEEPPEAEELPADDIEAIDGDEGSDTGDTISPEDIQDETNPLEAPGESIDRLIEMTINDDVWSAMMGELPCLDATETCVRQLQEIAVSNNPTLMEIDARIEAINSKIEEARSNNQASIRLGIFEPLIQDLITISPVSRVPDPTRPTIPGSIVVPEERGFLENVLDIFTNPVRGINTVLSFIGLPLFRQASGGDAATQQREIAIADLQVKVAEVERSRAEMANDLREEVILQVLEFDTIRREFQISQEVARRSTLRLQILDLNYRFAVGGLNTPEYLAEVNSLDQQKAQTFRAWARLRTQLTRIKLLVMSEGLSN